MARRRRMMGRRPSAQRVKRWAGDLVSVANAVVPGTNLTHDLVHESDYQLTAGIESDGMTLVRIRGQISYYATVVGGIVYIGIFVLDSDTTVYPTPTTLPAHIHSERIWSHCGFAPLIANGPPGQVEVDIRAKRKLASEKVIMVVQSVAQTVTIAYQLRCLLLD